VRACSDCPAQEECEAALTAPSDLASQAEAELVRLMARDGLALYEAGLTYDEARRLQ